MMNNRGFTKWGVMLLEFEKKCHKAKIIYVFNHFMSLIKCHQSCYNLSKKGEDLPS